VAFTALQLGFAELVLADQYKLQFPFSLQFQHRIADGAGAFSAR
jgi:hypothetical protein